MFIEKNDDRINCLLISPTSNWKWEYL